MNRLEEVEKYLEDNIDARETRNRTNHIALLLRKKYPQLSYIEDSVLYSVIDESHAYIRTWQKAEQDNPHLRGTDWKGEKKKALQQQAQIDLGYVGGFHRDVKKLEQTIQDTFHEKAN